MKSKFKIKLDIAPRKTNQVGYYYCIRY